MFDQMKPGDTVDFQYLEKTTKLECNESLKDWYREVSYEVKNYSGTILEIRDTRQKPIKWQTTAYQPNIERSRYLLTVRLDNRKIHSFYDGRMINVTHTPAVVPCVSEWKASDFDLAQEDEFLSTLDGYHKARKQLIEEGLFGSINLDTTKPQAKSVGTLRYLWQKLGFRV